MGHPTPTMEGATRVPQALRLPGSLQIRSLSSALAAPSRCPLRGSSVFGSTSAWEGHPGENEYQLCSRAGRRLHPVAHMTLPWRSLLPAGGQVVKRDSVGTFTPSPSSWYPSSWYIIIVAHLQ